MDQALSYVQRALAVGSDFLDAKILQAVVLRHIERLDQADEAVENVLALDPINFIGLYESVLRGPEQEKAA